MIGLLFLGAGLAWLAFSCYMAVLVAKDAAIRQPFLKFLLGGIVLSVMLVGPFLDHIIGMRQFKKLCDTQTGLHIFPGAANATQGKEYHLRASPVNGVIIAIEKSINEIIDVDTGEKIAEYNYFSTRGGWIGPRVTLGNGYSCGVGSFGNKDRQKYIELKRKINLRYGGKK